MLTEVVDPEIIDAREWVIASSLLTKLAPINIVVIAAAFATTPSVLGHLPARQVVIYAVRTVSVRLHLPQATRHNFVLTRAKAGH
jgi:hypothetical protein